MNSTCNWREKALSGGLLALRLFIGLGIAYHGYGKVFGGNMARLTEGVASMGLPAPALMAWMAALSEFAGGILIALGLGTRIAAFFVFATMCVAFFVAHAQDPFRVKELAYMYGVTAFSLILTGGGCYALESLLCCRGKCAKEKCH